MWILRTYRRHDDELSSEVPLTSDTAQLAEDLGGQTPTIYGSTPIPAEVASDLAGRYGHRIEHPDDERFAFFLDYDADHDEAGLRQQYAATGIGC
jgi:hypothetical protein